MIQDLFTKIRESELRKLNPPFRINSDVIIREPTRYSRVDSGDEDFVFPKIKMKFENIEEEYLKLLLVSAESSYLSKIPKHILSDFTFILMVDNGLDGIDVGPQSSVIRADLKGLTKALDRFSHFNYTMEGILVIIDDRVTPNLIHMKFDDGSEGLIASLDYRISRVYLRKFYD